MLSAVFHANFCYNSTTGSTTRSYLTQIAELTGNFELELNKTIIYNERVLEIVNIKLLIKHN